MSKAQSFCQLKSVILNFWWSSVQSSPRRRWSEGLRRKRRVTIMETKFENDPVTPSDWTTEFLGDRTEDWSRGKETRNQDILVKMLNNKHSLQSYHKLFLLLYYINSSKYLVTTGWSIKNVWIAFGYWSSAFQLSDLPVETPKSCRLKNKSVKDKYV